MYCLNSVTMYGIAGDPAPFEATMYLMTCTETYFRISNYANGSYTYLWSAITKI